MLKWAGVTENKNIYRIDDKIFRYYFNGAGRLLAVRVESGGPTSAGLYR